MSFTPSDNFEQRWLDSPVAMKQAIHDELDDIIKLLDDDTRVDGFEFAHPDLASKLTHLQTAHLESIQKLAQKLKAERAEALIPALEQRLDDMLVSRMDSLSSELKAWIRQVIQEELNNPQQ